MYPRARTALCARKIGCSVRARIEVSLQARTALCARKIGCSVRARTEVPLSVRFGREPKCVCGKTVIPRTRVYNVILWDDSCILGLYLAFSGDALRLCDCDSILRMYLMFGLSATTQEMLSTAQGAE